MARSVSCGVNAKTKAYASGGLYMWGGVAGNLVMDFSIKPAGRAETAPALSPFYAAGARS
ncbi:Uncharacterised protein [Shigella dysenteriae]|nr:Uncharacterised protein [Shigella dysenteriae]